MFSDTIYIFTFAHTYWFYFLSIFQDARSP